MSKCKTCNIMVLDYSLACPLCHTVLAKTQEELSLEEKVKELLPGMYPNVRSVTKKLNFVVKLYTFLAILLEGSLIAINYAKYNGLLWSAISGIAILYFYITLRYSILKNSGYKRVILTQVLCAVLLTIIVDFIVGYRGWSVNYVVPSAILLLDLAIIILMLVNMQNWQSYILLQIMNVIFSVIILILWKVGIISHPVLTWIAAAASAALFVGTLIFGDRRAKNELKRRFHM